MNRHLLALLLLCCAVPAGAQPRPQALSGIETAYIDASVRIQDDFFAHLNGKWLSEVPIPADRSSWGAMAKLQDDTQAQVRAIIEAAPASKTGMLYASFMDEKRREALGSAPLARELAAIRALRDKRELAALMARLGRLGVATPFRVLVFQDLKDASRYAVNLAQGGLGMPDRDYYLHPDDARLGGARVAYEKMVGAMLALVGHRDGAAAAAGVVALETALAQQQWTQVDNRDPAKAYTRMAIADLAREMPLYDWKGALGAAGVAGKVDYVVVNQASYLKAFTEIVARTELSTWKAYLEWQLVRSAAPYLSKAFVDTRFAFYGTALNGTADNLPAWKRGVIAVETAMGDALGRQYVQRHFPPQRKARMEALVSKLLEAYRQSIAALDWMGADTKREAQAKLAQFTAKIGYPDRWRDYSKLTIRRGDLVGNMMRARAFEYQRGIDRLGGPVERMEWGMTPQTVNAYYSALKNEIVFPAAILQPPYFDMEADDAVNYGAIGAVIGHEISHGFDDQGSQFDGAGNMRNWWTADDRANFQARADLLIRQYSAYSPLPGYYVSGALTVGENIGDNAGLAIAYKAYRLALGGRAAPVIDGLSGDQRFFMGYGQVWREKMREAAALVQIKSDSHAPGKFRTNGALVNQPAFHEAFGVKEGDGMYLAPQERVIIW